MTRLIVLPCLDSDEMAAARRRELDIRRHVAAALGRSAVDASLKGIYVTEDDREVVRKDAVQGAILATRSIPPDLALPSGSGPSFAETLVQVTKETTLGAGRRLVERGLRPLALNFANGVVPGGGFLTGAKARDFQNGVLIPGMVARPVYMTSGGLRDPNIFRVEVTGAEVPPAAGGEHAFTTAGRVMTAPIPTQLKVDRASYGETALGVKKLDVFVTAFPTMNPRLPAGGVALTSNPDMGYYDTACGIDPLTGAPTAPTTTGVGGVPVTYLQMFRATPTSATCWGQNAPLAIPNEASILDNRRVVPGYFPANVTDEVTINSAHYDPATATLTVNAVTSDCYTNIELIVDGFGAMPLDPADFSNTFLLTNLLAPPARVSVPPHPR